MKKSNTISEDEWLTTFRKIMLQATEVGKEWKSFVQLKKATGFGESKLYELLRQLKELGQLDVKFIQVEGISGQLYQSVAYKIRNIKKVKKLDKYKKVCST